MKLTQTLLLTAQLAATVVCQMDVTPPFITTWDFKTLEGDEALSYAFDYNPSMPHMADLGYVSYSSSDPHPNIDIYRAGYDGRYVSRLCAPRVVIGEGLPSLRSLPCDDDMTPDECEAHNWSYEASLYVTRHLYASSPYPCERMFWIMDECGIETGASIPGYNATSKGTFAEQNQCICDSDYYAAAKACLACKMLHVGNATMAENEARIQSMESASICSEAPTATKAYLHYYTSAWESGNPGYNAWDGYNTTIVSDGAQNKTDLSLYMTETVDFVPATIHSPGFTRTVDGKAVTMTPGVLKANAKAIANATPAGPAATGTDASTTAAAAAAATSDSGAADMRVSGGLLAAVLGAFIML